MLKTLINIRADLHYQLCLYLHTRSNVLRSSSNQTDKTVTNNYDTRYNNSSYVQILDKKYLVDVCTNVTPRVTDKIGRQLHKRQKHPIGLIRHRIQSYFESEFKNRLSNPIFTIFDDISPVVTTSDNFDSLLVSPGHPSRSASDTYYINSCHMLRSHTTAHDVELITMGFNNFLTIGDVYRRDDIDACHYPAFHQMDGVRLFSEMELFSNVKDRTGIHLFEKTVNASRSNDKQELHTIDCAKLLEFDLKKTLIGVTFKLFGKDVIHRWVPCYFPFTHPSWELEILYQGSWLEVLGCGILEQAILNKAGAQNKAGWAFGLGLDRLAMAQYHIPDIRLLWSEDKRFLSQFDVINPDVSIIYKPISPHLPRMSDVSFWIPDSFIASDFYDLIRSIGGDTIEKAELIDVFKNEKTGRTSHCYTITYQHMERSISLDEMKNIHANIAQAAIRQLGVQIR